MTAKTPLRFFVLTRQSFRSLLAHQPEIEQKVMAALEERRASRARRVPRGLELLRSPRARTRNHQLTSAPSTRMFAIR